MNVGRSTYSDRVKAILKSATSDQVLDALADNVLKRASGTQCEELEWLDVAQVALNRLHTRENVTLVTEADLRLTPELIERVREEGHSIVVITDGQHSRLQEQMESGGPLIRTTRVFWQEYNDSFQFDFIDEAQLCASERAVLIQAETILELAAVSVRPPIRISRTMRASEGFGITRGAWANGVIVLKRDALESLQEFASVLLHEAAHAESGADDSTREFESTLTDFLGRLAASALSLTPAAGQRTALPYPRVVHTAPEAAATVAPRDIAVTARPSGSALPASAGLRPRKWVELGALKRGVRVVSDRHGEGTVRDIDVKRSLVLVAFDKDAVARRWIAPSTLYHEA